jgi:hypothetical protein
MFYWLRLGSTNARRACYPLAAQGPTLCSNAHCKLALALLRRALRKHRSSTTSTITWIATTIIDETRKNVVFYFIFIFMEVARCRTGAQPTRYTLPLLSLLAMR